MKRKSNGQPTRPCSHCNGTGIEMDQIAVARQLRAERKAAGISLRQMATRLGISAMFLSDLERGRRTWHPGRVADFRLLLQTKGTR